MKVTKFMLQTLAAGVLLVGFNSCGNDDEADIDNSDPGQTITELAASDANYSTLVSALEITGLDEALDDPDGNFTVFAPDNEAFSALLTATGFATLGDIPVDVLTSTLQYHVLDISANADFIINSVPFVANTLLLDEEGSKLTVNISADADGSLTINDGDAAVVAADAYSANNGIIHGISAVLSLPPMPEPPPVEEELTVAGFLSSDLEAAGDFSTLLAAAVYAGLDDELDDAEATYTVFAPNNAAFDAWLDGAALDDFTPEEVAQVLLNHVIATELDGTTVTGAVPTYQSTLASGPSDLAGNATNISIFVDANADGDLIVNGSSTINGPDAYDASNGIIHAVESVIDLPMISTFAVADSRLSVLTGALVAQDLVDTVDGLDPATVLAPIDTAFEAITVPMGDDLTNVLTYHVISGVNAVASDVIGLTETPATVQGQTITVANVDDAPQFTGNANTSAATVVIANIQAINGVVHAIDTVLLPSDDSAQ